MSYILLVEDNQQNADMIIHILTTAGYEVKHFIRGLEGAKYARQNKPGLILMDFDLPDVDGRNLILALKKQLGGLAAPPIVAVTARSSAIEMQLARSFGCSAFIAKPFTPDKLLSTVEQLFKEKALP
ncbi:MAG: response regulator [Anaerolineae bacterium]